MSVNPEKKKKLLSADTNVLLLHNSSNRQHPMRIQVLDQIFSKIKSKKSCNTK